MFNCLQLWAPLPVASPVYSTVGDPTQGNYSQCFPLSDVFLLSLKQHTRLPVRLLDFTVCACVSVSSAALELHPVCVSVSECSVYRYG